MAGSKRCHERLNWSDAAIEPAFDPGRMQCITAVPLGDRSVLVDVWRVRLGRVHLYLLDTDLEENAPEDRELSARLYGGDATRASSRKSFSASVAYGRCARSGSRRRFIT